MVVARTNGPGNGFLKLELEPGWKLMRRYYGNRKLGHIYIYSDNWPSAGQTASSQAATPAEPEPLAEPPAAELETPTPLQVDPIEQSNLDPSY